MPNQDTHEPKYAMHEQDGNQISRDILYEYQNLVHNLERFENIASQYRENIANIMNTHPNTSRLWLYYINRKLDVLLKDMEKLNESHTIFNEIQDLTNEQLLLLVYLRG